jgi:hypothetical protein
VASPTNITESPWRAPAAQQVMLIVLYKHPRDWPNHYVLRTFYIGQSGVKASPMCMPFRSAQEATAWVEQTYPAMRYQGKADDTPIAGAWM